MDFERAFESVIRALWKEMGLTSPPRFGEDKRISLTIDQHVYVLRESEDGMHLYIEGDIGRLSKEFRLRTQQVERILRLNLALMTANGVCVSLKEVETERPRVIAQHLYPYAAQNISWLVAMIEDVAARVEALAVEVLEPAASVASYRTPLPSQGEDFEMQVIFRP